MEAAAKRAGKKFKVPKEIKAKEKAEKKRLKKEAKQNKRHLNDAPKTAYTFVDPSGKKRLWYRQGSEFT